ncbi:MAG TPA: CocE/NonD family hydrolase [Polyangiales bacterium]|nr:CocE/NonD family hydrolase [Polyangiales bacterium]
MKHRSTLAPVLLLACACAQAPVIQGSDEPVPAPDYSEYESSYLTQAQRDDEILAWIAEQSWSNGQVATIGASVSAMLAEAVLASGAPSLQAGIVRATEWDQYSQNLFPGGVPNPRMQELVTHVLMDMRGEPCLRDMSTCEMYGP